MYISQVKEKISSKIFGFWGHLHINAANVYQNLLEIDHINPGLKKNRISPLSQGISKTICELDNLQLLCKSCHKERSKHQRNAAWNLFKSLPLEKQEKLIEDQLNAPTTIS